MSLPDDEPPEHQQGPAFLAQDTWSDKGVRFGCGAALGLLVVGSVAIYAEGPGLSGMLIFALVMAGLCGTLGVTRGERFFEGLLRAMRWL